jgi:autotransporter passenger strand-loop-strand repeat protein
MAVASGGVASGTTVSKSLFLVSGIASATQLNTGTEVVSSGGMDFGATVSPGSELIISAGGTASGAVVGSAGELDAGSAVSTSLLGGSWMAVASGGVASGTTVSNSLLLVSGTASGNQLNTGTEVVSSGGVDVGAHINSAGFELVSSGGIASSAIISGGALEVASGGSTGSGAVTFAVNGGGFLQLDDSAHFRGLVAGFAQPDLLALTDLSFVSGATSATWSQTTVSSGTLAVANGATTVDITLLGQYSTGNFNVSSAIGGGSVVSDPPLTTQTEPPPGTLVNPR